MVKTLPFLNWQIQVKKSGSITSWLCSVLFTTGKSSWNHSTSRLQSVEAQLNVTVEIIGFFFAYLCTVFTRKNVVTRIKVSDFSLWRLLAEEGVISVSIKQNLFLIKHITILSFRSDKSLKVQCLFPSRILLSAVLLLLGEGSGEDLNSIFARRCEVYSRV